MDHYNTLGVAKNATQAEIKTAFRNLAKMHHPDKGGDHGVFQNISNAYNVLSNPQSRAEYDNPPRQQYSHNPFGGSDFSDIFNNIFGQGFGGQNRQNYNQQQVYRTRVAISLLDAYNGVTKVMKLDTANGTKVINIIVPPGIDNGAQMRYDDAIADASLIVEFHIMPDLRFDRHGYDLVAPLSISVLDLIIGTTVQVDTISGKKLDVIIPPMTQPFHQINVSGHGMHNGNGSYGNLILLIKAYVPTDISPEIITAIHNNTPQPKPEKDQ